MIVIDRRKISVELNIDKVSCVQNAFAKALRFLEHYHHQILLKKRENEGISAYQFLLNLEDAILKDKRKKKIDPTKSSKDTKEVIEKPSVALKMMKMMGWSGSGLGAKEQGITEPIQYV